MTAFHEIACGKHKIEHQTLFNLHLNLNLATMLFVFYRHYFYPNGLIYNDK